MTIPPGPSYIFFRSPSEIECRVLPHDFRKPGEGSAREVPRIAPFIPFIPWTSSPRDRVEEKRKGREFVFLPSNLFGLLSLASRVFDNNGPAGIRVPIPMPGRAPVEIVTAPRAATRGRFRLPSCPRLGEIYLPRKSTGGTLNSISSHKEKKTRGREGKKREKTRIENALPSFVSHTRYVS